MPSGRKRTAVARLENALGIPFDLSEVLFIATANFIQNIPGPLLDRMEVVEFSGYTEREKLQIAKHYLVRRQQEDNGLAAEQLLAGAVVRRDPAGPVDLVEEPVHHDDEHDHR